MRLATFNEWSSDGYRIKKGSKCVGRLHDGTPLFSEHQVFKPEPRNYGNHWKGCTPKGTGSHWDDPMDYDYDDPFLYDNWMGN